jgi:hypothetical protein
VDPGTSRQVADRIIITYVALGGGTTATDWVEKGYFSRPGEAEAGVDGPAV